MSDRAAARTAQSPPGGVHGVTEGAVRAGAEARPPGIGEPLLAVDEDHVGRRAVLSVAGEVDVSTVAQLRAAIDRAAATSADVWVDLSETTFMDSSGVHALIEAHFELAQANRRLALICPDGPVLRILRLTCADRSLEIHATRSAAHFAT